MKSFKSLLGVLVVVSIFTTCPIFSADNDGQEEEAAELADASQAEGVFKRCFGPGTLAQGCYEYCVTLPKRSLSKNEKIGMVCIASGLVASCMPLICCDYVPDDVCDGEDILGIINSETFTLAGVTISMFGLSFLYNRTLTLT